MKDSYVDAVTGIDEGYVKYDCAWTPGPDPEPAIVAELNRWREPLFAAGLVGHYAEHDVGYGNISVRHGTGGQFVVTGTQTGHIDKTQGKHYSLVTATDIAANRVECTGGIRASSEAMTHAALYSLDHSIGAVVHVHSAPLWQYGLGRLPTTDRTIAYGTPEMARAFVELWNNGGFAETGVAVMAGHEEGLVSVGHTLEVATRRILELSVRR